MTYSRPRSSLLYVAVMLLHFLALRSPLMAQFSLDSLTLSNENHTFQADSIRPALVETKSPTVALIFSALLPGAGQAYNESFWKVPIFLGLGTYFVAEWISNNNLVREYRGLYEGSITAENPGGNLSFSSARDFYKSERDTFTWYFLIMYLANLVDAYVDAALYDFNVNEDLTMRVIPEIGHGVKGLRFQIQF